MVLEERHDDHYMGVMTAFWVVSSVTAQQMVPRMQHSAVSAMARGIAGLGPG